MRKETIIIGTMIICFIVSFSIGAFFLVERYELPSPDVIIYLPPISLSTVILLALAGSSFGGLVLFCALPKDK